MLLNWAAWGDEKNELAWFQQMMYTVPISARLWSSPAAVKKLLLLKVIAVF